MIVPSLLAGLSALALALPAGAVLEAHARTGSVYERLDGAASQTWRACASACGLDARCRAWTWREARSPRRPPRCELLAAARTPQPFPGAVTGLSPAMAERIEDVSERAPTPEERRALRQLERERGG